MIRDNQRNILKNHNVAAMHHKKLKDEEERRNYRNGGTSPPTLGDGYQQQLDAMTRKDQMNQMAIRNYETKIGSPYRQKHMNAIESEFSRNNQYKQRQTEIDELRNNFK